MKTDSFHCYLVMQITLLNSYLFIEYWGMFARAEKCMYIIHTVKHVFRGISQAEKCMYITHTVKHDFRGISQAEKCIYIINSVLC